jgi:alpha-1,2-glucosyltransferase
LLWIVLASLALGFGVITHLDVGIGDEDVHQFQINWFLQGRYEIFEYVTVLPLYHLVVAKLAQWTGLTSLDGLRFVHMVFAAGAIPAFFMLCRTLYPAQAATRTLQFLFIPFLFPLFFLTYTDLPALLFVFLMLERTLRQKYLGASVLALIAVAMRQPNIVWVGFAGGLIALYTAEEMSVRLRAEQGKRGLQNPEYLMRVWHRAWYLVGVVIIFAAFVIWNGGVAMGDAEQHKLSLNLSNLYFCRST